jgi:hypothetical protein
MSKKQDKLSKNLVSPAKQLVQQAHDRGVQREMRERYGEPETVPGDVQAFAGPRPTIYNAGTGEWEEVMPEEGRMRGIPIGPPNPEVLKRMWGGETGNPLPMYGSDILRT